MKRPYLLWLSFFEGTLVLAVELCGTKLLSPVLGSSVYVWSFMLSVTLAGLAAGYYTGGYYSEKENTEVKASWFLATAALFALLMPFISERIFYYFGELTFLPLLALECVTVLLLPLFFLGSVSPLLIKAIGENEGAASSSRIFTLSTLGGVISGLIISFILIESVGVKFALLLFCCVAFMLASIGIGRKVVPYGGLFIGLLVLIYVLPSGEKSFNHEILYHRNGILGDIRVVRFKAYDTAVSKTPSTWLFVNNISQTMYDPGAKEKYFTYNYRVKSLIGNYPSGSNLLLCGMGGGSIIDILKEDKITIEVCELDERMPVIAQKYFGLKKPVNITIDDARHFIRTRRQVYDAVILDIFKGEETPNHVLSIEGLNDLKKIIHDTTIVVVNSHGYLKGKRGEGNRAIYKTLKAAGFNVTCEFTDEKEEKSNLLFICRISSPVQSEGAVADKEFETIEPVLTDKIPRLEKLNRQAALTWRSEAKGYLLMQLKSDSR